MLLTQEGKFYRLNLFMLNTYRVQKYERDLKRWEYMEEE